MFHFQSTVTDWPRAVAKLPAGAIVKAVDRGDILRDAKAANSGVKTALRHWYDQGQVFGGTLEENRARARQFFSTFIDGTFLAQYAPFVDYVEEWNEYIASSHTSGETVARLTWARAAAEVWSEMRRADNRLAHIRLVLCNTAVGNSLDRGFAEIAIQHDCILGYHAYDHWQNGQRDPASWQWHSGRWHFMEQAWGLKPRWMFTEAGPYADVLGGWRAGNVLGGDVSRYVEAMRVWIREVKQTTAYREGRVLGFNLFTTGGGSTWQWYETRQPELDALADMIRAEWTPVVTPPPPPVEPDPPSPSFIIDYTGNLPVNTASPYYPYVTRTLSAIDSIIIHHSDSSPETAPEQIAYHHTNANRWPGIGYHFVVAHDGRVYKTNKLTAHSFHAGTANGTSIGVCLTGTFTSIHPTPAQLDAGAQLIQWIHDVLGEKSVLKHRDVSATQCPGNTWAEWWDELIAGPAPEPSVPYVVTAHLLPPNATLEDVAHVLAAAYPPRQTVLFSADDAARLVAPGMPGSKVIAWAPERWGSSPTIMSWLLARGVPMVETRALPAASLPPDPPPAGFRFAAWPTDSRIVTQPFGANPDAYARFGLPGHEGIDLRAPLGAPVYAVADGAVTLRANAPDSYGNYLVIDHGDWLTYYAHLSQFGVAQGATVKAGQQIGAAGNTGNSSAAHLHLSLKHKTLSYRASNGVFWPSRYHDPTPYLEAVR